MSLKDKINYKCLPKHVAIIMDGNGRWAKCHGKDRLFGHQNGVESVREVTEASVELGIKYLTLYAFSTENWNRPQDEVEGLMHLMIQAIENETPTLMKNNVRVEVIGDTEKIDQETRDAIDRVTEMSKNNDALTLIIALSYSSRWEIEKAVRDIAIGVKNNEIEIEDINQEMISNHLCTKNFPDPDLLIRTSGEYRISNFLMWQLSYAELYFTPTFWPDFKKENYYEAILDFQSRERRFGKTSEQINK